MVVMPLKNETPVHHPDHSTQATYEQKSKFAGTRRRRASLADGFACGGAFNLRTNQNSRHRHLTR